MIDKSWFRKRKLCRLIITFIIMFVANILISQTEWYQANIATAGQTATKSDNIYGANYDRVANSLYSYIIPTESGYDRVEIIKDENSFTGYNYSHIVIESYDDEFNLLSSPKTIIKSGSGIDKTGCVGYDENYNYILLGQDETKTETFTMYVYDKSWNLVTKTVYGNEYHSQAFLSSPTRMYAYNGDMYIITGIGQDNGIGGYHQGSCLMKYNVNDGFSSIDEFAASHSLNHYAGFKNGIVYTLHHGDASPRTIMYCTYNMATDERVLHNTIYEIGYQKNIYNRTGVDVGGFEISNTHMLVAYRNNGNGGQNDTALRSIYLQTVNLSTGEVNEPLCISNKPSMSLTPQLVQMNSNRFIMMWQENYNILTYILLDGSGNPVGNKKTKYGVDVSDCQPVVVDGIATWYVTGDYNGNETAPTFYQMDADGNIEITKLPGSAGVAEGFQLVEENGSYYLYKDGEKTSYTGLQECTDGNTYYFVKGKKSSSTTLVLVDGVYWYIKKGQVCKDDTLVYYNSTYWHVKDGKLYKDTGFVAYKNGQWYVKGGKLVKETTLVSYKGEWWYIKNGQFAKETTLVKYGGRFYHVKDGKKYASSQATFVRYNNSLRCVKYGQYYTQPTVAEYNGVWYYADKGVYARDTLLFRNGSEWWYIHNGRFYETTRLIQYKGVWWYVKGGKLSRETGLVRYGKDWWYVKSGKLARETTLVKHGNGWYCVKDGKLNRKTCLTPFRGRRWYCKNGRAMTGFTGSCYIDGKTYYIRNGVVVE